MSTAMVTLNCLVYESKPALSRIFSVEVDPSETIGVLRKKIYEENPLSHTRLDLYTPKTPIPTTSKAEFDHVFADMNLRMKRRRNSAFEFEKLHPTSNVEDYPCLKEAAEERLHVIIFLAAGRYRSYLDYSSCYLFLVPFLLSTPAILVFRFTNRLLQFHRYTATECLSRDCLLLASRFGL
jgi:Crinkler effector protein N-terminal domain